MLENRPEGVTQERIDFWTQQFMSEDIPADLPSYIKDLFASMPNGVERVWCTGQWVGEQLRELGASDEEASDICFALGQKMTTSRDPWKVAQAVVSDYKQGVSNTSAPLIVANADGVMLMPPQEDSR